MDNPTGDDGRGGGLGLRHVVCADCGTAFALPTRPAACPDCGAAEPEAVTDDGPDALAAFLGSGNRASIENRPSGDSSPENAPRSDPE